MNYNINVATLTDREKELYFEGIALGQRMAGTALNEKFSLIKSGMNEYLVQLIFKDANGFVNNLTRISMEDVAQIFNKESEI